MASLLTMAASLRKEKPQAPRVDFLLRFGKFEGQGFMKVIT